MSFQRVIVVTNIPVTAVVRDSLDVGARTFEFFLYTDLLVDITQHELVPDHSVLMEQETINVLKRYNLHPSQLPRMRPDDPIARFYGLSRGHVVKIVRKSETAGRYVTYRIVM